MHLCICFYLFINVCMLGPWSKPKGLEVPTAIYEPNWWLKLLLSVIIIINFYIDAVSIFWYYFVMNYKCHVFKYCNQCSLILIGLLLTVRWVNI